MLHFSFNSSRELVAETCGVGATVHHHGHDEEQHLVYSTTFQYSFWIHKHNHQEQVIIKELMDQTLMN